MKSLLMIVLLFSFSQARAEQAASFLAGNKLLELCEAYLGNDTVVNVAKGNTCAAYIMGIEDAHQAFVFWKRMEQIWCTPKGMETSQLVRVATKFLQENPQKLHLAASSLVPNALISAFPCE